MVDFVISREGLFMDAMSVWRQKMKCRGRAPRHRAQMSGTTYLNRRQLEEEALKTHGPSLSLHNAQGPA